MFEQKLIEAISVGLPFVSRPYKSLAIELGCTESDIISGIDNLISCGDIKRFGIVVRHRELGYQANGMVVWDIPDDKIRELGQRIGRFEFVTLCYQRPRHLPDWPYNLFSMVHGRCRKEVIEQVEELARSCELEEIPHKILFSNRCFKQRGARYSQPSPATEPTVETNQDYTNG